MVSLQIAQKVNHFVVTSKPLVAVFVGGTSGIGEYTLRALVAHHGKDGPGLRIYLVGRNRSAADKILDDCRRICPKGQFMFIKADDLSLLKDVDKCCKEIESAENEKEDGQHDGHGKSRINLLVMSHSDFYLGKLRRETSEGNEKALSLLYYSRIRFLVNLLPLLLQSTLPARVISIYAAGLEAPKRWHPEDLSLRKNYSFANNRTHCTIMKTILLERIAQQHPGKISLTHVFPSLVITPSFTTTDVPLWFRAARIIASPLARLMAVSEEEIGERVLFFASERYPAKGSNEKNTTMQDGEKLQVATSTDGVLGGGAYSCSYKGDTCDISAVYEQMRKDGTDQKIWDHTMAVFKAAEEGRVFQD